MADDATAPPTTADDPAADAAPATEGGAGADDLRHWIDLTLGAWRPREAAGQLASRLGVDLGPGLPDDPALSPVTVGPRAIDVDAIGDPVALLCHDDARRIAAALPAAATVVVLAPRFGLPIGTLNDWFFHFLRRFAVSLVLLGDEPATVMARSAFERRKGIDAPPPGAELGEAEPAQQGTLRFFPGLLPRAVMERAGIEPGRFALIPVGGDHYMIPPAYRDLDPLSAASRIDAMEAIEAADAGFAAFGQSFCTSHFADSERLSQLARSAFHAGEIDLARGLAARARSVARTPDTAAAADLIRQEIRLYQRRFNEIAANAEPSRRAPAPMRDRLSAYRLRAEIESGNRDTQPSGIEAVLARLDAGAADCEDLDLLCRHLARRVTFEAGDGTAALATKVTAAAVAAKDDRLVYLAMMNGAAIARKRGDRGGERIALRAAFATSDGSRGLAEVVAMNVLLARSEAEPTGEAAGRAWLRSGLAWLASDPVEAFPFETSELILGTGSVPRTELDHAISTLLAAELGRSLPAAAEGAKGLEPPLPIRSSSSHDGATRLIGVPGAAVLWRPQATDSPPGSPARQRLAALVWAAISQSCKAGEKPETGTLLVDTNLGRDVPASKDDAASVALRAGVEHVLFARERITLDTVLRPRYIADLRVGLSPAVARIDDAAGTLRVAYRRHLAGTEVSGREADLLGPLRERDRLQLGSLAVLVGMPISETEQRLRGLEARRIVRVEVDSG